MFVCEYRKDLEEQVANLLVEAGIMKWVKVKTGFGRCDAWPLGALQEQKGHLDGLYHSGRVHQALEIRMDRKKKEDVPMAVRYSVLGRYFETSYEAEKYAITEVVKNPEKNALTIKEENGYTVYATVCVIKSGVLLAYYNGTSVKYTNIMTFYVKDSSEHVTVALSQGNIVQL